MANKPIDDILETLAQMPVLHRGVQKNIFNKTLQELPEGVSRHHLEILQLLLQEGTLHVAEIAELLFISKSQMTRLIDELISLELIERQPHSQDRRKSNILLTSKGRLLIETIWRRFESNVEEWLSSLDTDELERLSMSLKQIQTIIMKMR